MNYLEQVARARAAADARHAAAVADLAERNRYTPPTLATLAKQALKGSLLVAYRLAIIVAGIVALEVGAAPLLGALVLLWIVGTAVAGDGA